MTDTITNFGVVFKSGTGFIGIDKKDNFLFKVFKYDNGPDYISDELFRIIKNGKIGYADSHGKIIIKPRFECAYPFSNGIAKVSLNCNETKDGEHIIWESNNWFYIDKTGKRSNIR
ncbi:MAG: WG repeat-containing protein [Mariniphaga sp.]|nr:WG repeat-containing protein [Mariniphaga sp.]